MDFKDWLNKIKVEDTELASFITKIETLFTGTGLNISEFERKVAIGVKKIDVEIDESLNLNNDAENR
ncbi:hypothetical protein [Dyadobacter diqingensis]|uniref:hypothetical protein n=1 Tax=Dyadobacter diqingensis TaxID=2938121 RepID=UPI0020C18EEB|nr:hypothetical protein [Dyadobacter diqingensis]